MTTVSDHAATGQWDSATSQAVQQRGAETIERYETENGVVFFDAHNPLAWVEAAETLSLDENL